MNTKSAVTSVLRQMICASFFLEVFGWIGKRSNWGCGALLAVQLCWPSSASTGVGGLREALLRKWLRTPLKKAVVDRLALICVEQYNRDPEKDQKLKKMMEIDSWNRDGYVREQGWGTMPGEEDPDRRVSSQCANLLSEMSG